MRLEVESTRGGVISHQIFTHIFEFEIETQVRVTEDGNTRVTEDNNRRTLEE